MHTVDLLEQCLDLAVALGYQVRQDWLGGSGGGACQLKGQKWLFVDLAASPLEQLDQAAEALRNDPAVPGRPLSPALARLLDLRKTA
jgi:hypothetical protein